MITLQRSPSAGAVDIGAVRHLIAAGISPGRVTDRVQAIDRSPAGAAAATFQLPDSLPASPLSTPSRARRRVDFQAGAAFEKSKILRDDNSRQRVAPLRSPEARRVNPSRACGKCIWALRALADLAVVVIIGSALYDRHADVPAAPGLGVTTSNPLSWAFDDQGFNKCSGAGGCHADSCWLPVGADHPSLRG